MTLRNIAPRVDMKHWWIFWWTRTVHWAWRWNLKSCRKNFMESEGSSAGDNRTGNLSGSWSNYHRTDWRSSGKRTKDHTGHSGVFRCQQKDRVWGQLLNSLCSSWKFLEPAIVQKDFHPSKIHIYRCDIRTWWRSYRTICQYQPDGSDVRQLKEWMPVKNICHALRWIALLILSTAVLMP